MFYIEHLILSKTHNKYFIYLKYLLSYSFNILNYTEITCLVYHNACKNESAKSSFLECFINVSFHLFNIACSSM